MVAVGSLSGSLQPATETKGRRAFCNDVTCGKGGFRSPLDARKWKQALLLGIRPIKVVAKRTLGCCPLGRKTDERLEIQGQSRVHWPVDVTSGKGADSIRHRYRARLFPWEPFAARPWIEESPRVPPPPQSSLCGSPTQPPAPIGWLAGGRKEVSLYHREMRARGARLLTYPICLSGEDPHGQAAETLKHTTHRSGSPNTFNLFFFFSILVLASWP